MTIVPYQKLFLAILRLFRLLVELMLVLVEVRLRTEKHSTSKIFALERTWTVNHLFVKIERTLSGEDGIAINTVKTVSMNIVHVPLFVMDSLEVRSTWGALMIGHILNRRG